MGYFISLATNKKSEPEGSPEVIEIGLSELIHFHKGLLNHLLLYHQQPTEEV